MYIMCWSYFEKSWHKSPIWVILRNWLKSIKCFRRPRPCSSPSPTTPNCKESLVAVPPTYHVATFFTEIPLISSCHWYIIYRHCSCYHQHLPSALQWNTPKHSTILKRSSVWQQSLLQNQSLWAYSVGTHKLSGHTVYNWIREIRPRTESGLKFEMVLAVIMKQYSSGV